MLKTGGRARLVLVTYFIMSQNCWAMFASFIIYLFKRIFQLEQCFGLFFQQSERDLSEISLCKQIMLFYEWPWVGEISRPHTESPQEKDLKTTCLAVYFIILLVLLVTQLTKVI